ncbi:rap guanine nucleotide exchange factor 6-like isoform X5 [Aotus nancymaae]|uniref:rap guanine nucleotide exchange factor 6-like isoform X5 n=1 Tax=Aotus nancymaae TaxID=37293 RepID=UPI0030FECB29
MKNPPERTPQDLEIVYSYLHGMEALSNLREHQLRLMCETVRHERHEANEVLYYPDDIGTCWYIFLSGSVFIKESMFLPRSSFGKRSAGSFRRGCECIVLEPSEMIVERNSVFLLCFSGKTTRIATTATATSKLQNISSYCLRKKEVSSVKHARLR